MEKTTKNYAARLRNFFKNWKNPGFKWAFRDLAEYVEANHKMPDFLVEAGDAVEDAPVLRVRLDGLVVPLTFAVDKAGVNVTATIKGEWAFVCSWGHYDTNEKGFATNLARRLETLGIEPYAFLHALRLFSYKIESLVKSVERFFEIQRGEERETRRERVQSELSYIASFVGKLGKDIVVKKHADAPTWDERFYTLEFKDGKVAFNLTKSRGEDTYESTIFKVGMDGLETPAAVETALSGMEHCMYNFEECMDYLDIAAITARHIAEGREEQVC